MAHLDLPMVPFQPIKYELGKGVGCYLVIGGEFEWPVEVGSSDVLDGYDDFSGLDWVGWR